jgi:hypothetical protein
VEDYDGAVEEIRKIEAFSHFLLPLCSPIFNIQLVMYLSSCSLQASCLTKPLLSRTSNLRLLKIGARTPKAIEKEAGPKGNEPALIKALRESWNDVVRPVVENLPQIWWCPTCLLLLNAAGECGAGRVPFTAIYLFAK